MLKNFKDIINNRAYVINSDDRKIFEEGNLQAFFGLSDNDVIEVVLYDSNDNQIPQADFGLVRYIALNSENIRDYFMLAEGTLLQRYALPSEYFIDVERIIKEAGFNNGVFKVQITLLNNRVGTNKESEKLWIAEISPSRTEIRLYPLRPNGVKNPMVEERFNIFTTGGDFREDTIEAAFAFIGKIKADTVTTYLKKVYGESFYNKLKSEYDIKDFDTLATKIHNKFIEAATFEFTNRVSNVKDGNYGKPKKTKPTGQLSKTTIINSCKNILVTVIDSYLQNRTAVTEAININRRFVATDEVAKILQLQESDTIIDNSNPVIKVVKEIKNDNPKDTEIKDIIIKEKEKIVFDVEPDVIINPPKLPIEIKIPTDADILVKDVFIKDEIKVKDPIKEFIEPTKEFIEPTKEFIQPPKELIKEADVIKVFDSPESELTIKISK